ncbi:MAG TPA: DUF2851 family protein [Dehalococcoidia bacterium]|nr:DUF2851 family protein [Dehalococcoidia bacterium]
MITRNRIRFSEKQAALIWQQALGTELTSAENEPVNVIYPGRINGDNGPDFRDAVIVNRSRLTRGDVEVHVKSSDWYGHDHHTDAAYNNVILHVAMWHDSNSATLLQSGKSIPLLCLAKALRHQAYLLPHTLPCFRILDYTDGQTLAKILNTAGEERFRQKAMHSQAEILDPALKALSAEEAAGQVLYRGMMRALGYAKNTKPFEDLANRLPLASIETTHGLAVKQALLLGTAGLLPSQRGQGEPMRDEEIHELEQIWQSTGKKIEAMRESDWNFSHIYPNNSPVRRIIAQSYLLERYRQGKLLGGILQLVKEAPSPSGHLALENGLIVAGDGYWRDHFDFDVRSRTAISTLLGNNKAGEITVNVILPFAFTWGQLTNEAKLTENAIDLCRNYPRSAENGITRHMAKQLCLEDSFDFTACHQQGLIHIFRNYCREGKCSECPLAR